MFHVLDADGNKVGQFGLTFHGSVDASWTVLTNFEDSLTHLFGEKWMEKR